MNGNIQKALRNKLILEWYNSRPVMAGYITKPKIMTIYAKHLGCPVSEIVPEMTGDDDLEYLWATYRTEIEDYSL
jgi:hypothetical protein